MVDRDLADQKMREHYERVWSAGDAWEFERSPYEQSRYQRQLSLLRGEQSRRGLEIGCGSGCFTHRLLEVADEIVAVDISPSAIERARTHLPPERAQDVQFRVANIMDFDFAAELPYDLIVLSETIYCLGWLYPIFDIAQWALSMRQAMAERGRLLLANTYGAEKDWLLHPCLIDTYRDLFRNVGFELETESIFTGPKHGQEFRVLMSLFRVRLLEANDDVRFGNAGIVYERDP